ncbi:ER-golgi trafficking TRAPP I complex 85 kDa subunit-domain-containing protein [Cladorrhinum samala]|uniref:ER-golgi trafficking TRAPP I complex 85 kDa subunit-domain-containing protein n=1 Tax=Cladorrhinum samala TaxID=585594 RepID=A0AAV9HF12_9PEZI|nr:ER-golgi trafficking TRAPP I complex 85 kDa subunit-domain-containing protein [Cladorrhinum samala]
MQPHDDAIKAPSPTVQSPPMAASPVMPGRAMAGPQKPRPGASSMLLTTTHDPLSQSEFALPVRTNSASRRPQSASLFRSTLLSNATPPGSPRSASPASTIRSARSPARALTGSIFAGTAGFRASLLDTGAGENPGDPLNLILKSFVPHVAIHASQDVDELVNLKGFQKGLWELLRPFGERVTGKVNVRDSNGVSKSWEDFSVRFSKFGDRSNISIDTGLGVTSPILDKGEAAGSMDEFRVRQVEQVVERHLSFAEEAYRGTVEPQTPTRAGLDIEATSPYYALYLRRLLSGMPLASHESFTHPVACVIAISSRNPNPIEALHRLYSETTDGDKRYPVWVDGDYLRYYVLVHDEENSDITKSMALFEQMKRNFGLHCHLLRLRSSESAETDDDSIPLPRSDWMTAAEELADIEESDTREDFEDPTRHIFESDATAIRTFVREMVTQSIIPTMERNIAVWNDQVASRRRGISGRFMSLSKRFTFGGSSRSSTTSSSSNYDMAGFYRPESPEAIMRRLADFAFMLRDWKLAMSTYDLLRSDFQNDKAWRYHAAANEMAALALLIMPQSMSSKTRIETINTLLENAFYSYQTRCNSVYGSTRCIILALELLRLRGGSGIDEAVRWGIRVLESRLMGNIGDALLKERMAICYASKTGAGSQLWGSRRRKSALWSVLGAEAWMSQHKYIQAQKCLNEARKMYSLLPGECGVQNFAVASDFLAYLNAQAKEGLQVDLIQFEEDDEGEGHVDEENEMFEGADNGNSERRPRKTSLINPIGGSTTGLGLETAPLQGQGRDETAGPKQDGFG